MTSRTKKPIAGRHDALGREIGPNIYNCVVTLGSMFAASALIVLLDLSGGTLSSSEVTLIAALLAFYLAVARHK
jgi:hypothetical protein